MNAESSIANHSFSFDLKTLFFVTSLYALGLKFGLMSLAVTTLLLFAFWPVKNRNGCVVTVLLGLALLIAFLMSASPIRPTAFRIACQSNMRQLALGMHNYEASHKHFPPAFKADGNGKPMLSWRVLLLPWLGEKKLFAKFDLDEPWDGSNNIKLLDEMPAIFQCPNHRHKRNTIYKLITGPGTAFDGDKTLNWSDIEDGSSNTLMLTEDFANPVPWTKPSDLTVEMVVEILSHAAADHRRHCAHESDDSFGRTLFGSGGALMDGSTYQFGPNEEVQTVRRMCLIADGNTPDVDSARPLISFHKPEGFVVLGIYLCLLTAFPWVCR